MVQTYRRLNRLSHNIIFHFGRQLFYVSLSLSQAVPFCYIFGVDGLSHHPPHRGPKGPLAQCCQHPAAARPPRDTVCGIRCSGWMMGLMEELRSPGLQTMMTTFLLPSRGDGQSGQSREQLQAHQVGPTAGANMKVKTGHSFGSIAYRHLETGSILEPP